MSDINTDTTSFKKQGKFDGISRAMSRFGQKLGKQKHLSAIRDSFAAFLPAIIAGSLATLIGQVVVAPWGLVADLCNVTEGTHAYEVWNNISFYILPLFDGIANATMNMFSVYLAILLGYYIAQAYGRDRIQGLVIALASFLALDVIAAGGGTTYLTAQGIVFAIFAGLLAPMLLFKLSDIRKLQIRMPDGVPPVIAGSLNALIPFILTITIFSLIQPVWGGIMWAAGPGKTVVDGVAVTNADWYYITNAFFSAILLPLQNLSVSPLAVAIILLGHEFVWFFGVHSSAVFGPFINTFWTPLTMDNIEMFGNWTDHYDTLNDFWASGTLNVWNDQTFNTFGLAGAGSVLELGIIVTIFSKLPGQRKVSNIAMPTSIFGISEPYLFGIPIILNPVFALPFITAVMIKGMIAYAFTSMGLLHPTISMVPWTTPMFLSGFLATMDWMGPVVQVIGMLVMLLIWTPFVLYDTKSQIAQQAKEAGISTEEQIEKNMNEIRYNSIEKVAFSKPEIMDIKLNRLEKDLASFEAKSREIKANFESETFAIKEAIDFAKSNQALADKIISENSSISADEKQKIQARKEKEKAAEAKSTEKLSKLEIKSKAKISKIDSKVAELSKVVEELAKDLPKAWEVAEKEVEIKVAELNAKLDAKKSNKKK